MPSGKRTRYFVHRDGFEDGTAYVRYEGEESYLVVVERASRQLRSDVQRVEAGYWRELTRAQAAEVLHKKRGAKFTTGKHLELSPSVPAVAAPPYEGKADPSRQEHD